MVNDDDLGSAAPSHIDSGLGLGLVVLVEHPAGDVQASTVGQVLGQTREQLIAPEAVSHRGFRRQRQGVKPGDMERGIAITGCAIDFARMDIGTQTGSFAC